ncbi:MAG: UDP-2,3-diacylglucosamine diphosphatase [Sulfuriferula sp.]
MSALKSPDRMGGKAHSLFISDLHLCESRPQISRLFFDFMETRAGDAEALYILGDLFESWVGDDDETALSRDVIHAIRRLTERDVAVYLMHGNRDFLLAQAFADACGAQLLEDPTLLDLYGQPTLLMHGDTLCTDDTAYLAFRAQVRDPAWQAGFLAQPLAKRHAMAQQARTHSEQAKQEKTAEIMDVNNQAVIETLRKYGYPRLIHGHTHRPAHHQLTIDGHACERWVLQDWYDKGGYLRCDSQGCASHSLNFPASDPR